MNEKASFDRRQFRASDAALGVSAIGLAGCAQTSAMKNTDSASPIATVAQGQLRCARARARARAEACFKHAPYAALQRNASKIPLRTGCTDQEVRLYLVLGCSIDKIPAPAFEVALRGNAYPGDMLAALESDGTFRIPALRNAEQRAAAGAPVWRYKFAWSSPSFSGCLGAGHVVDLPFVFNTLGTRQAAPFLGGQGHQPLATEMHARWIRFIKKGDAGWPRHELATRPTMRFATTSAVFADPLPERRRLWSGATFN